MKKVFLFVFSVFVGSVVWAHSFKTTDPKDIALFPQQNDFRNVLSLSGIWKFKLDPEDIGEKEGWYNGLSKYRSIAVPGSWNEQFTDTRDYMEKAWYETDTYIPGTWKGERIYLRIGSATYAAKVWINGTPLGQHEGGHVPFAFDISPNIKWNSSNKISIQIENIQSPDRVPTGDIKGSSLRNFPAGNYDFFPYAGLNREVHLYTLPKTYIKDITVITTFESTTGTIELKIEQEGKASAGKVIVSGEGRNFESSVKFVNGIGSIKINIPNVRLWSTTDPFLYDIAVHLNDGNKTIDRYTLKTGVRTIAVTDKQVLLNGEPIFLKGFGKHEDFPIFGRGSAYPVIIKDFSLFKWIGANSFRTTHYPYDEEFLNMADREGILVIDEIPAVGLYFDGDPDELKSRQMMCRQYINELYSRDKNHPSVIMWCVANEPSLGVKIGVQSASSEDEESFNHMAELFQMFRDKDPTRLVTFVGVMMGPANWHTLSDVVCINRYYGWYTNTGDIAAGVEILSKELDSMHKRYNKPIMITEFGADTYPGMHAYEPEMYTEEFQLEFIKSYLDAADSKDYMAGMHIWNFADFKTSQNMLRFGGYNLKGVFTRDRKPKMAAHYLRSRWTKINEK